MTREEQKDLTLRLHKASMGYYSGKDTEFSDIDFDLKFKELQKVEKENNYVFPFSPTLRVGSDLQENFKKVSHPRPMITIENTYDNDGLQKWIDDMHKMYSVDKFNLSVKYDGISCELHYHNGILVSASTRGNRLEGDDITENVRTIASVPLILDDSSLKDIDFYVRGEILFDRSMLHWINEERVKKGETPFANCRNACAGSIKQLDPKVTASRRLLFRAWDCFTTNVSIPTWRTMESKFSYLSKIGFYYEKGTEPMTVGKDVIAAVEDFKNRLSFRSDIRFDFDGIVIKIDDCELQNEISTTDTRAIEWGIARKWNEDYMSETIVEDVIFQVGRTGNITPVAKLKPVECGGVVISNATLNNEAFIENLNLHIGDKVSITRSGGVIPMICSNITSMMEVSEKDRGSKVVFPTLCPDCGKPLTKYGEIWKCYNEDCPSKVKGRLLQWCSKDCMDIKSIGESVIDDFYNKLNVTTVYEIYGFFGGDGKHITNETLKNALGEGYGDATINKIRSEVIKSKSQPLERILYAIGIEGIGKVTARLLAKKFNSLGNIFSKTTEELMEIDGIGEVLARNIAEFKYKEPWLRFLNGYGFNTSLYEVESTSDGGELNGLSVVFSGKATLIQGDVEEFLESHGTKTSHSISKKTNYLITGEKAGASKVSKATELGVEIISEKDFCKKFGLL